VLPAAEFFSTPRLRQTAPFPVLVYGPDYLFRSAWLSGAWDYLREPWTPEELFLRLRGCSPPVVQWMSSGKACRLEGRRLLAEGGIRLSAAEAELLRLLALRRGSVVSRAVLAWTAGCLEGRVVDTLIGRLRAKLERVGLPRDLIASARGLGYRLP
jgi:DNA-binding response OmpR family regulator